MPIDTLKAFRHLRDEGGFSEKQADAIVDVFTDAGEQAAPRGDTQQLSAEMDSSEDRLSQKLESHLEALQESSERFKAEVREDLASIKERSKWTCRLAGATLTILIIVVSLVGILVQ
jgi:phytoene dehydrogenase-like protein